MFRGIRRVVQGELLAGMRHRLSSFLMGLHQALITHPTVEHLPTVWKYDCLTTDEAVQDHPPTSSLSRTYTRFVCFLNSYCRNSGAGMAGKALPSCSRERVGVVGATGSYESPWHIWWVYEGLPKNRYLRAVRLRLERWLPGWFPGGSGRQRRWRPHLLDFPVSQSSYSHQWIFITSRSDDKTQKTQISE